MHRRVCLLVCLAILATSRVSFAQEQQNRFEPNIQRFEARDKETPPAANAIVFVGSSSIARWDLTKSFPDLNVINRGFGGSVIADSVLFCERIVNKYKPPLIVFYAGDNDIGRDRTPDQILADYQQFVGKVRGTLPETKIVFISIKPSLRRWDKVDNIRKANSLIREYVKTDPKQVYLDIEPTTLGEDGKPKPELFVADGLHNSELGYEIWAKQLRPLIVGAN